MSWSYFNKGFLIASSFTLMLGFIFKPMWVASNAIALIPALYWILQDLKRKNMGSDLLAVLSLSGTLLTHEYFAGAVIALMLATGRVLENWAEGQATRQLESLISRIPRIAHRKGKDGGIAQIDVDEISIGDVIIVRSGEIVATDGVLINPATLDESALTGEPLPVNRLSGEAILSGVVNASNPFEYTVSSKASESTFAGIITLVRAAQARTSPGVRIANQWAIAFVPFSILVATLAWAISGDATRAVAVLVAATPCPLILAVPIAVVAGLSNAAKNGAIIKGGGILEALARVETVLLDKTGTITHGGPQIDEIVVSDKYSIEKVLQLAASVDQFSQNIIGKTLVEAARSRSIDLLPVTNVEEVPGHHISGLINGSFITVGQPTKEKPDWFKLGQPLIVAVTKDEHLIGAIGLSDPLRPESKDLIAQLGKAGVQHIALVTGDKRESAQEVARSVGITEVHFQITAAGKVEITQAAKRSARGTVVVVGDGINDAPALAEADIGVAMGARGASAASEAADVVIVEDSIDRLTIAIAIAQRARRKALQSAGIGMGMSAVVMGFGAVGAIAPGAGALAQEVIDLIAIAWALTTLKPVK